MSRSKGLGSWFEPAIRSGGRMLMAKCSLEAAVRNVCFILTHTAGRSLP